MAVGYGLEAGLGLAAILVVTGAATLGLSHAVARRRGSIGPLSRQFALAVALATGSALLIIGVATALMFVSAHDALTLGVALGFAGAMAIYSSMLMARGVMQDIDAVRGGLLAVGEGDREVTIRTEAHDELAELAAASNRMIGQLKVGEDRCAVAWAAHRDLIAAVSHDLRTPLTSLRLVAEAIEDGVVDDRTRDRYLSQLPTHIRSLGNLIDDLFELSRLQAGDVAWSIEQVRLDQLVEETVEAMQAQAQAKGVAVEARIDRGLPPARANPEKVQRVLFNLIQNAIRHTPADGTVTVAAETVDECVEIEVKDTGNGIEADDHERVFEPFFKGGDGSARSRDGAGLGLTICRAIVEAHGGHIWLAEQGQGARVRFSLPQAS